MEQMFNIFKLGTDDVARIAASENEPHTHDYEELLVGVKGTVEHFIDFDSQLIEAPFISFVAKGKVHRVVPGLQKGECEIWGIRFRSEFIAETTFQLYSIYHDNANMALPPDRCFKRLETLCQLMEDEVKAEEPDYSVVRHLLSALFTMIEAERRKLEAETEHTLKSQSTTFKSFLKTLEENFRRPEGVEFYAEKLFMSSRNLNIICKNILQQSVSEIIETRKLIEAKNLLLTTDKTVAEIGFELGYSEKSYFSNVFKRREGITPGQFRKEKKTLIS
ncbi:helix-turn-helix domain-containing protein [Carboxylicivirga caseinilyticus]|uniref:helix-turn-helix domain-containing protein n=1 Tax=Carboxylicivirga caseinilyticus TaxID=3417572 RepID=UPI003D3392A4|nr:helix-turn-helix transcriptional regulator [Marinilabiliaceae bacterium A049]